ncbi:MAG TPA: hypothetical protein VD833_23490 [Vicinamibacterales bacterium]|nr:hypothetical protein [Vicinamibacterales bacterium]
MTARADAFLHSFDAAGLGEREPARLGWGNAFADSVQRGHLDEGTDLVVQLLFGALPPEDPGRD